MTTPLSLGFASAYQKIEDKLPHTQFGVSAPIRTGINDLSRGGETAFSQAYADDQIRRYMGKVKSDGLATSQYLLGIHPNRRTAPAKYVAPIFSEGQAHGLHGGMIDKNTQPLLAKIWANKAEQLRALATPQEVGTPAFLPSEAQVSFNAPRDEKQQEKYIKLVDVMDSIQASLSSGVLRQVDFLGKLSKVFQLLGDVGYTMNNFEVKTFLEDVGDWTSGPTWDTIREAFTEGRGEDRDESKARLVYEYMIAIYDLISFIGDINKFKTQFDTFDSSKNKVKQKISEIRKTLKSKETYNRPLPTRGRGGAKVSKDNILESLISKPSSLNSRSSLITPLNSIGVKETKEKARQINEKLIKH
jgi:hypothetical protein